MFILPALSHELGFRYFGEHQNCRTQPLKVRCTRHLALRLQPPTHCLKCGERFCRCFNTARDTAFRTFFKIACWLSWIAARGPKESLHGEARCCTRLRSRARWPRIPWCIALLCDALLRYFLHCGRRAASINSAVEQPLGIDADRVQRDDGSPILHPSSSLSRPRATHGTIMQSKLYMLTSTCKLNGNEARIAWICLL